MPGANQQIIEAAQLIMAVDGAPDDVELQKQLDPAMTAINYDPRIFAAYELLSGKNYRILIDATTLSAESYRSLVADLDAEIESWHEEDGRTFVVFRPPTRN